MMKHCLFSIFFNQFQKVLIFNLFLSACYKIYFPSKYFSKDHLLVVFFVLIKGVLFWKRKNIGTVSYPEVIFRSLQLHFVKYHKKEPLSQTLVCCYIMALLFLETLSCCSVRKVSVSNIFFILLCFDWLKTFLNWVLLDWLYYWFYIWMWSHAWRVLWK